jgi:aspartate beta-hydroxylase
MTQPIVSAFSAQVDPAVLWRTGAQALRGGDPRGALKAFQSIIDSGRADATVWLGVAIARRDLKDLPGESEALDRVLAQEPYNLRALVMKGDHYVRAKDPAAASSYYRAAARLGEATADLPADLRAEAARAAAAAAELTAVYETHLKATLQAKGLGAPGSRRMAAALDLMLGKTEIFLQQPKQFYFPELPQIQFYPRESTPWLAAVDAATDSIREELIGVLKDEHLFRPYIEREPDRPFFDTHGLLDDPGWSALFLYKGGEPVADNLARCPKTMAALAQVPLCRIPGRTPSILFSLLRPGARIPPHNGLLNTRLICHLPLIVPQGCGFRVGNETRPWVEGSAFAFDDSVEHEAWNTSDQLRVVLIFDVWRPELSDLERELVGEALIASDAFTGKRTALEV